MNCQVLSLIIRLITYWQLSITIIIQSFVKVILLHYWQPPSAAGGETISIEKSGQFAPERPPAPPAVFPC